MKALVIINLIVAGTLAVLLALYSVGFFNLGHGVPSAPSQLHQEHLMCDAAWKEYTKNPTDANYATQRKLCDGR